MKVGLIGFAGAGKTSLFQAVAEGAGKGSIAAVRVPDPRFDKIVAQVRPKKATPATVTLTDDLDDAQGGTGRLFTQRFLDEARKLDLLLHVVRAFDSDTAPFHADVDPQRDIATIEDELGDRAFPGQRAPTTPEVPGSPTAATVTTMNSSA